MKKVLSTLVVGLGLIAGSSAWAACESGKTYFLQLTNGTGVTLNTELQDSDGNTIAASTGLANGYPMQWCITQGSSPSWQLWQYGSTSNKLCTITSSSFSNGTLELTTSSSCFKTQ